MIIIFDMTLKVNFELKISNFNTGKLTNIVKKWSRF